MSHVSAMLTTGSHIPLFYAHHDKTKDELHSLDVPQKIEYKIGETVYRCRHGQVPRYLADHFTPAVVVYDLRSANRNCLTASLLTARTAVGRSNGPTAWNSLPDELRNAESFDSLERFLKTTSLAASRY